MKEKPLGRVSSVNFDERTPDEEGFAAIFALVIGPSIRAWNENRVVYATLREKRTDWVRVPLIIMAAATGACTFFALIGYGPYVAALLLGLGVVAIGSVVIWTLAPKYKGPEPAVEDALKEVFGRFGLVLEETDAQMQDLATTSNIWPAGDETETAFHFTGRYLELEIDARWLVRHRTTTDKDGNVRREPTFRGWFMRVRPPYDFAGTTVIIGKKGGLVTDREALARLDGVQLEDRAFEERFAVYSTDQVETRVILSPDVMHYLNIHAANQGKTTGDLMLSFEVGIADIALPQPSTSLHSWNPQDMAAAVDDIHAWFTEIRRLLSFIDGIDTLAENEGFRGRVARQRET